MKNFMHSKWIGVALAVLGVAAIFYGIYRGEVQVVLTKGYSHMYRMYRHRVRV